jgi:tetratricopeptide (TPR) repeat protein
MIGNHLMRLNRFEDATILLEKAYEANRLDPQNLSLLIRAYQLGGQSEKAIEPLQEWLKLNPNDQSAKDFLETIKENID